MDCPIHTMLRALHERRGLSEQSQELLPKLMAESPTGPKRLKGLLPAGTVVAHKTGTSGTENGVTAATNDIGIPWYESKAGVFEGCCDCHSRRQDSRHSSRH